MKNLFPILLSIFLTCQIQALPTGFSVESGDALASLNQDQLVIDCLKDSVIQWNEFSIQEFEQVHFHQLLENSLVINRVIGPFPSEIHGCLFANGQVYLLNPNGIMIGPKGQIFSAGFLASTYSAFDPELLNRTETLFQGNSPHAIINLGKIVCSSGSLRLLARRVENLGHLEAPQGEVSLVAGSEILLQPEGMGRVLIRPSIHAEGEVVNQGTIEALSIQLEADGNPYSLAIQTNGVLKAHQLVKEKGRILLKAHGSKCKVEGECIAEGSSGGQIDVFADQIEIQSARLDVSGKEGGGQIRVGGDFQGKTGPDGFNSSFTSVSKDSFLVADATAQGNGGKVIVWSDGITIFPGTISAQGKGDGFRGGFAEVSGIKDLVYTGISYLLAENGLAGDLLLDPTDVTISSSASSNITFGGGCGTSTYCATGAGTAILNAGDLQTQLGSSNVTIVTTGSGGTGIIQFSASVSWSAATSLTCGTGTIPAAQIIVDAGVTISNTNSGVSGTIISFTASGATTQVDGITLNGSASNVALLSTLTGDIVLNGTGGVSGTSPSNGILLVGQSGSVSAVPQITTTTGNITLTGNGQGTATGVGTNLGSGVLITNFGSITSSGGSISITGVSQGAAGVGVSATPTTLSTTGSGSITIQATGKNASFANFVSSPSTQISTVNGNILIQGNTSSIPLFLQSSFVKTTGTGAISVINAGILGNSTQPVSGAFSTGTTSTINGGNISFQGTSIDCFGTGVTSMSATIATNISSPGTGTVTFNATGGTLNLSTSTITATNGATFTSTGSTTTLRGTVSSFQGNILFNQAVALSANSIVAQTSIAGNITFSGAITGARTLSLGTSGSPASTVTLSSTVGTVGTPLTGLSVFATNISQANTVNVSSSGLSYTASGTTTLSNNITASSVGPIQISGAITLNAASITLTAGGFMSLGTISGAGDTLTVSSGSTTTISAISALSQLTVSNGDLTISGAATATTVSIANVVSAASFQGAVNFTTLTNNVAGAYSVSLSGGGTITNAVNFTTSGGVSITGSPLTFTNGITSTTSTTTIGTTIFTAAQAISLSTVTLSGTSLLDTTNSGGSAGANITVSGNIDGTNSLTMTGGTGAISVSSIGGTTALSALTMSGASLSLNGSSIRTSGGAISLSGATTINTGVTISTNVSATSGAAISLLSAVNGGNTLSLNAGTGGLITLNNIGNTTALTSFTASGGSISFNGTTLKTAGGAVQLTGAGTLNASLSIDATNSGGSAGGANIAFNGATSTLNAASAGSQTLSLNGGTGGQITLAGSIGATTRLGTITFTNAASVVLGNSSSAISIFTNAFVMSTTPTTSLSGDTTINTSTNNGAITFGNTIDGAKSLTLTSGSGIMTLPAAIGGVTPLSSFSATSSSTMLLTGNITTSVGAISFTGPLSIAGANSTMTAGTNVSFTDNTSTINGARTLAAIAGTGGTVTFGGNIGTSTALTSLSATATTITLGSSGALTARTSGGVITMTGAVSLAGGAILLDTTNNAGTPAGNNISFSSTLNGTQNLTLNAGTTGSVTFSGIVGGSTRIGNISISAKSTANAVNIASNITSNAFVLNTASPTTLNGNSTINTSSANGNITFPSTINGVQNLTLNAGTGTVTLNGAVGNSAALLSLSVTGNAILVGAGTVTAQGGTLVFNGPVTLSSDTTFTDTGNTGITFNSTITGNYNLTISATNGSVAVNGAIDTSGVTGKNVNISSSASSVIVNAITASGSGGAGGNITLQPSASFTTGTYGVGSASPNGTLQILGSLISTGTPGGAISLSATGRTQLMSVATIYGNTTAGDLIIQGDSTTMGLYEAMTIYGQLTITAVTSSTLSDLVSLNGIAITSPTINILLRDPGQIIDNTGILYTSSEVHFLSGGAITTTGTKVNIGTGASPQIRQTSLTQSQLLFSTTPLNFDLSIPSPSPSTGSSGGVSNATKIKGIYSLAIDTTQLIKCLPHYPQWFLKPSPERKLYSYKNFDTPGWDGAIGKERR